MGSPAIDNLRLVQGEQREPVSAVERNLEHARKQFLLEVLDRINTMRSRLQTHLQDKLSMVREVNVICGLLDDLEGPGGERIASVPRELQIAYKKGVFAVDYFMTGNFVNDYRKRIVLCKQLLKHATIEGEEQAEVANTLLQARNQAAKLLQIEDAIDKAENAS